MKTEQMILSRVEHAVRALYGAVEAPLQLLKTRREFEGDFTLAVFPLAKSARKAPDSVAREIGDWLVENAPEVARYNVEKGFLNLTLGDDFWLSRFSALALNPHYGQAEKTGRTVMVEYSSPNTNKPLHLGHVRNNLLGYAVSQILKMAGNEVIMANLVNDRGIHICKSMIAWERFGGGETPSSSGMKGDHLVGKYYVEFDKHYKAEIATLRANGMEEEEAKKRAPLLLSAQEMLRKWEAGDADVRALWAKMNGWVYDGFALTYNELGVSFDRVYYESQTYLQGKELVEKGLASGVFYKKADGSVWCDLTADGLDEKLLLRGDGTSVYMTQDLGTAYQRFEQERLDEMVYVVGNEQNYHFQVLKLVLSKLGCAWAEQIHHLSYGMVELPEGKMKSREGTVVDADDLMEAMVRTAREMSVELGKLDDCTPAEADAIVRTIGLGALKYFILKVDPRKTMLFDPRESIDFNGNTGPFIQYTHARIRSMLRKAEGYDAGVPGASERELVKLLDEYEGVVTAAAESLSPALVAAYAYDLAKTFNGYYHDVQILREPDEAVRAGRLRTAAEVARVLRSAMALLGIELPERM